MGGWRQSGWGDVKRGLWFVGCGLLLILFCLLGWRGSWVMVRCWFDGFWFLGSWIWFRYLPDYDMAMVWMELRCFCEWAAGVGIGSEVVHDRRLR